METGLIIMAIVIVGLGARLWYVGKKCKPKSTSTVGVLHVNVDDLSSTPGMFLTLNVPVEEIVDQKKILLSVNVIQENSQK